MRDHSIASRHEPSVDSLGARTLTSAGSTGERHSSVHWLRAGTGSAFTRTTPLLQFPDLIGDSAPMQALYSKALSLAEAGHPILITGKVGSGKSALARALHRISSRSNGSLCVMRSVAFPDCLASEEEAGLPNRAGEPAIAARFGHLVTNGTLILDEVGDLPFAAQTTLARLLLGQSGPVNVIALSHMDLQRAVVEGRFRSDLLCGLSRGQLEMPSLRERPDDLKPLAALFKNRLAPLHGQIAEFSDDAFRAMLRHTWPGNVRELRNRIERAMLVTRAPLIQAADLGLAA
ncbi:sigma-54-dependent transcriptional regulator [Methylolobus aquaticus]